MHHEEINLTAKSNWVLTKLIDNMSHLLVGVRIRSEEENRAVNIIDSPTKALINFHKPFCSQAPPAMEVGTRNTSNFQNSGS